MLPNSFQRHRDRITSPCEDATPHLHWRLHVILTIEAAHANPARLLSFASESLQSHQQISWSNFLFGGGGASLTYFFHQPLCMRLRSRITEGVIEQNAQTADGGAEGKQV